MSGFRFIKLNRTQKHTEKVREIESIYGPEFWRLRSGWEEKKETRKRVKVLPILTVRLRTRKANREKTPVSPPLSVLSRSAVVNPDTTLAFLHIAPVRDHPPAVFTTVKRPERSQTPNQLLIRRKTPYYPPPRIQTKSAVRVSSLSHTDASPEVRPSPWVDSSPIDF